MGGFYGSVQVRGADRNAIKSVVKKLASKMDLRFLVGPDLGGWVGLYPAGHGQDTRIGREMARKLTGELFHFLVHDDDFFVYEYYRDGKLVDRYNSRPDYFQQVSASDFRNQRGRPELFDHLAPTDGILALKAMLADPDAEPFAFASTMLERFAQVIGIRNVITSYEYLQDGELDGLEGWDQFEHVPDLSSEMEQKQQLDKARRLLKESLMREGLLLSELGGQKGRDKPTPQWCPAPDRSGFLVGWSEHAAPQEKLIPLDRCGPPWPAGPASTPYAIDPHPVGLTLSPTGRYLAVAHSAREWTATLWDLNENRRLVQVPHGHAVCAVGFSPDEKSLISVGSYGEQEGRVVIAPVDGSEPRIIPIQQAKLAVMHPSGTKLVIADHRSRLTVVDVATRTLERTCWVGCRKSMGSIERNLMAITRQEAAKVDYDEIEKKMRKQQEQMLARLDTAQLSPGIGSIDEFKEQMLQQMTLQIRRIREENAQIGTPEWEAARVSGLVIIFRMMFDPSGEWLCLGTSGGAWVYPWSDVVRANEDLPRPALAIDAGPRTMETDRGPTEKGDYVYALNYDHDRERFLFGGLEGRVRYVEPSSGRSGALLEPPGRSPINQLGLSLDGSVLGLTIQPDFYSNAIHKVGPVIQFWNYPALSETAVRP
jgi:WD40 repeat protein